MHCSLLGVVVLASEEFAQLSISRKQSSLGCTLEPSFLQKPPRSVQVENGPLRISAGIPGVLRPRVVLECQGQIW